MNLPLYIGFRYVKSKKKHNIINLISWIAIVGISVTTAALIVVLSVFNGFNELIDSLYTSFSPDIKIYPKQGKTFDLDSTSLILINNLENVALTSSVLEDNVLLKHNENQIVATAKGIENNYFDNGKLTDFIAAGTDFNPQAGFASIGYGISYFLGINLSMLPQKLTIVSPKRTSKLLLNPSKSLIIKNIYVATIFSIQQEIDDKYLFIPMVTAQELFETDKISSIEVTLKDRENYKKTQKNIEKIVGESFYVKNIYQQNESLYKVMKSEKLAIFLLLSLIIFISAFNIISSLSILILNKKQDIAILNALGANVKTIKKIFLTQGMVLALIGCVSGMILGYIICFLQATFGLVKFGDGTSFIVNTYPVKILGMDFVIVLFTILLIGFITTYIPVSKIKVNLSFNRK
ncbi:MAG: FtsX-like permease family protein [Bacteroidales bacterium]|jgi:lipoprotein-releasing system permease protein